MKENKQIIKEIEKDNNLLAVIVSLLKDIADGIKETNAIRKQEQTELWKEVKDLKRNTEQMYDDIYRESEVRSGILQTEKNLKDAVLKIQNIIYVAVGIITFINMLPVVKDFIILLTK